MLIDGKVLAKGIYARLQGRIAKLPNACLAVFQVGDCKDSSLYIGMKQKAAAAIGLRFIHNKLPASIKQAELKQLIRQANEEASINGVIVQLPLPGHLPANDILDAVSPQKDVDGLGSVNNALLARMQEPLFVPCTPAAILHCLQHCGVELSTAHVAIIGKGHLVGTPLSYLLNKANATVSLCHSLTQEIKEITSLADIVIAAAGCPLLVRSDWIKPGAIVIDVGINFLDGKLVGDVAFEEVSLVASHITPVPGGIGPLTVAKLLENTVLAAERAMQTAKTK